MLRVAHTITRLAGGAAYRTVMLAEKMNMEGIESRLFYGQRSDWDPSFHGYNEDKLPIGTIFIPEMKRNLNAKNDIIAFTKMLIELRKFNPHVIHAHESKDGFLARAAGIILGTPVIIRTYHGLIYYRHYFGEKPPRLMPLFIALEKGLNFFSDMIVSIATTLESDIVDEFQLTSKEKVITIPNGFNLEPFLKVRKRYWLRRELNLGSKSKILSVIANFQPPKDHKNILLSFKLLKERNPSKDFHLVLVGSGPLEEEIRLKINDLNLNNTVHILGYRTDIPDILGSSHLSFLGSSSEGTPGSVIEALAAGTKSVATNVGGMEDVLNYGKWGTLVKPRDPLDLAKGIETELSLKRNMKEIRSAVKEKHDIVNIAKQTAKLYRDILDSKGIEYD